MMSEFRVCLEGALDKVLGTHLLFLRKRKIKNGGISLKEKRKDVKDADRK